MNASNQLTPNQIAQNLSNPDGELGKAVGELMNRMNLEMSKVAYSLLQLDHGSSVLEIGPGNGALVDGYIVTGENAVTYKGVDISETMIQAASERNSGLVASGRVEFVLAPAEQMPFPNDIFDRAVTVNCIYFWDIPKALVEIHRVLRKGGRLVVASNTPETMASNPFTKLNSDFRNIDLDKSKLAKLHNDAGFSEVLVHDCEEQAKRVDGTSYVRRSYMTIATKRD